MTEIAAAAALAVRARKSVGTVIRGYEEAIDLLLVGLATGGHVLLEGVPGVGKTTLAKTFAITAGLDFKRIQLTSDLMPTDITGHSFYNQHTGKFEIREGPAFTNILLADEINRAPPRTQSALLEAMEERQVTIDGKTLQLPDPFLVIATKNPIDIQGVYPLPEAQLDRFMLHVELGYPERDVEMSMLQSKLRALDPLSAAHGLPQLLRAAAATVRVHRDVVHYLLDVVRATRSHPAVELGAGPRAASHLMAAARAAAVLEGRDHVVPDDVKRLAHPVLSHRLMINADSEIEGLQTGRVVQSILDEIPVPIARGEAHAAE